MEAKDFVKAMVYYTDINPKGSPDWGKPHVCEFWFKQLAHLEKHELKTVMDKLIIKPFWPSLGEVLDVVNKRSGDPKELAADVASRIFEAIGKGSINGTGENAKLKLKQIYDEVGDIGQLVIERQGGWNQICDTVTNSNASFHRQEWRTLAEGLIKRDAKPANRLELESNPIAKQLEALCDKTKMG